MVQKSSIMRAIRRVAFHIGDCSEEDAVKLVTAFIDRVAFSHPEGNRVVGQAIADCIGYLRYAPRRRGEEKQEVQP